MQSPMRSRATPAVPALPPDQGYEGVLLYRYRIAGGWVELRGDQKGVQSRVARVGQQYIA